MQHLVQRAATIGAILRERGETVAVAESSAGGLVSAALLAIPGASAWYRGGGVIYTRRARHAFLELPTERVGTLRSASEPYALLLAQAVRQRLSADWGLGESGAAGPSGNPYGDAPGHTCLAVDGKVPLTGTLETGSDDRLANMFEFARELLDLLVHALATAD